MALTHIPTSKFLFKHCVILTSIKPSASQRPWPFVMLKENKCNCSWATGWGRVVQHLCGRGKALQSALLRRTPAPGLWARLDHSHTAEIQALGTGCSSSPPALSLARPRTVSGRCEAAQQQGHRQPRSAGQGGWREPVPCLLLTHPTLGVQRELSQARQSYSLIWEGVRWRRQNFQSLLLISLISG